MSRAIAVETITVLAPRSITIFEGPDGGGKSTAAKAYAQETGAAYVHCGPFRQVGAGSLARLYIEAMMPALMGYQDVVLDRCWLSEQPYGHAFRHGVIRLSESDERMLARVALRCGAVVVMCMPPWEVVQDNFVSRRDAEMLESTRQLKYVFNHYAMRWSPHLPMIQYDYTQGKLYQSTIDDARFPLHAVGSMTAGRRDAPIVICGDSDDQHTNFDPLMQFPFVSFGGSNSRAVTRELGDISEQDLFWMDTMEPIDVPDASLIIALGPRGEAATRNVTGVRRITYPHPFVWSKFEVDRKLKLDQFIQENM